MEGFLRLWKGFERFLKGFGMFLFGKRWFRNVFEMFLFIGFCRVFKCF